MKKMKIMRQAAVAAVAVATLSTVGLSACGSGSNGAEGKDGVTNIVMWHGFSEADGKTLKKIVDNFNKSQMDAFRYRMNDGRSLPQAWYHCHKCLTWYAALRAVTKVAIREARTRELRQELLRSETLKR